jgi:hypothetical protein
VNENNTCTYHMIKKIEFLNDIHKGISHNIVFPFLCMTISTYQEMNINDGWFSFFQQKLVCNS